MTEWQPSTQAEAALRDALRGGDQDRYFHILSQLELLLPVPPEGQGAGGWGTWTADNRTHVLAFTSVEAMYACLAQNAGSARKVPYLRLAEQWPNHEWWLAVNPGLPIEGYLPAWFIAQLAQQIRAELSRQQPPADPRQTPQNGATPRSRAERLEALTRAQAGTGDPGARQQTAADAFGARSEPARPAPADRPPTAEPLGPGYVPPAYAPAPAPLPPAVPGPGFAGAPQDPARRQEPGRQQGRPDPELTTRIPTSPPYGPPGYGGPPPVHGNPPPHGQAGYGRPVSTPPYGQPGQGQPGYNQPGQGYNQSGQGQPGYHQPGNQPGPGQPGFDRPLSPAGPVPAGPMPAGQQPPAGYPARPQPSSSPPAPPGPDQPAPSAGGGGQSSPARPDAQRGTPLLELESAARPAGGRHADAFLAANEVERQLFDAAEVDNTDLFLSTLLLAQVLIPVAPSARSVLRPSDPGFGWQTQQIDGQPYVVVYTSSERAGAQAAQCIRVRFIQLISAWPDETWSFAVNPGTPVGATLPGDQVVTLANWAGRMGLSSEETSEIRSAVPAVSPKAAPPTVMQKPISPSQIGFYLERGYDRVSGFVHRAHEVGQLKTPDQMRTALGLTWAGTPFEEDADEIFILRWSAYRPSLYRIPYGGQTEAAMKAMEGWVIERPPFRGNGFAPGESSTVIAEFKVDSARLPHGARLLRLGADGVEEIIAVLDADGPRWLRVGDYPRKAVTAGDSASAPSAAAAPEGTIEGELVGEVED